MSRVVNAEYYDKMVNTPVSKLVIELGIPTTISMLVTNIYNMADTFFVSSLGNSASGAVGVVFGLMAIIQACGFMYGHGAGSIIARKLGQGDVESAEKYASTSFFASLITGALVTVLGFILMGPLMRLLGSTSTILPYAKGYGQYILAAAPIMMASFVLNNILRYEGKAYLSMWGLIAGAVINIVMDPILIFGCGMGIAGAGLSTALSQCVSFLILLSMFLRGKTESRLRVKYARYVATGYVLNIMETGLPSLIRQGLNSISTMILNHFAGMYGSDAAIAAMSIVNRITFFVFAVGLGIGQGFQPVSSFNYGARKYSRVKKAFFFTLGVGEALLGVFAVVAFLFSGQLVGLFRDDVKVIEIGTLALRFQLLSLFFQPLTICTNMLFQSVGANKKASFMALLRSGLYFIPAICLLSLAFGLIGVQIAQPVADILSFITAAPLVIGFLKSLPEDEGKREVE
ncbi:MAG: MATE family efflux transporter [Lachnospiraceae bacterium]|nr:MATE family efflux transporter [Lachnospiraceae bacterium]